VSKKEQIINAFKELSYNQGFYAVRMEELATRAGVSKRTIYLYFKGKEDLVDQTLDSFLTEFPHRINQLASQADLVAALAKGMETVLREGAFLMSAQSIKDLQVHYPAAWQRLEFYRQGLITSVLDIILQRTEKAWVRDMDPRIIRESVLAINRRFSSPDFAREMGMSLREVTLQLAKLIVYPYV
jgi:AcrR family transcriptional regulator